jgi:MFS family permease
VFAWLWAAAVLGNIGSFMRDVASAWLITELSPSAATVALVQAAATLPIFLLAIPAGVLSDILDRRRLLIAVQVLLACASAMLMLLSALGWQSVGSVLALTLLGGVGAALMAPAWQSIVPELVQRAELRSAVALNSLGLNVARAIGPALGGLMLVALGAAATYGADLLSYALVIAVLLWWPRQPPAATALPERFGGALRAGLRYACASRELRRVLLRAGLFFLFASAVWALLPLVARRLLGGSAGFYGLLLGGVGCGAILGALLLPWLRRRLAADGLVLLAALVVALVMALLALAPPRPGALGLMVLLGLGWITALTTFNGVAQAVLPDWVRGRGLALYLMSFNGAMTAGSLAWGQVAQRLGLPLTLVLAAAGLVGVALALWRVRLPSGEADLAPARHWPEPELAHPGGAAARGPVLVQIAYRVRREDREAFVALAHELGLARRRDGARDWGLGEHSADPECLLEWFVLESWAEHERQHQRVSRADAQLQARLQAYHQGPPPRARHYLSL